MQEKFSWQKAYISFMFGRVTGARGMAMAHLVGISCLAIGECVACTKYQVPYLPYLPARRRRIYVIGWQQLEANS